MTSRFLDANGLRMHVLEAGQGPLVILAHGFPETSHSWRHQLSALSAAGFRAVAPDMRGFGQTEAPADVERYTVLDLVGDLVGLLDALDEPSAIVVGNDWGSTVAWQAALMRPDRFRAVAAVGVPMMANPPLPPTRIFPRTEDAEHYTLYFQDVGRAEEELERDVGATLRKVLFGASRDAGLRREGDDTPNPFGMVAKRDGFLAPLPEPATLPHWLSEEDLDIFVQAFRTSGFRGGLNYYRNLDRNWHLQRSLAGRKAEVPALYLTGEQDPGLSIPGMKELIAAMPALVPNLVPPVFIPDCGHWAPQEKPGEVSRALVDFARSL
ncbi:alpha/beta fold hydrolase [Aurantimonas sp. HBX-1]|uniref:alpha/beta fold hydrolase n=1 Tax=Aurantimonas sp. HBX-1 TaxID=2906072 RepID=UPI001F1ED6E8|nr:alpha/beta hydrolase [Aurantimonas sp. HBX-1]UIJ73004.1 alpha/beta hydrolase [Aurantimonas sp. HBX-1]